MAPTKRKSEKQATITTRREPKKRRETGLEVALREPEEVDVVNTGSDDDWKEKIERMQA